MFVPSNTEQTREVVVECEFDKTEPRTSFHLNANIPLDTIDQLLEELNGIDVLKNHSAFTKWCRKVVEHGFIGMNNFGKTGRPSSEQIIADLEAVRLPRTGYRTLMHWVAMKIWEVNRGLGDEEKNS